MAIVCNCGAQVGSALSGVTGATVALEGASTGQTADAVGKVTEATNKAMEAAGTAQQSANNATGNLKDAQAKVSPTKGSTIADGCVQATSFFDTASNNADILTKQATQLQETLDTTMKTATDEVSKQIEEVATKKGAVGTSLTTLGTAVGSCVGKFTTP